MDLHSGSGRRGRHLQKNPTEPKKDVWMAEPFNIRSYMSQFSDKTYHIFISQNLNVVLVGILFLIMRGHLECMGLKIYTYAALI